MPTMVRETWTDERLDDLSERVDNGFREVRVETRQLRSEMSGVREELGELRAELKGLNEKMDKGFDSLNRTLQIAFSLIGIVLVGLMGLIGTQL